VKSHYKDQLRNPWQELKNLKLKTEEEAVEPTAPAVTTAYAAVACSVYGNAKLEDFPQITTGRCPM
jgi:hypothetical protein